MKLKNVKIKSIKKINENLDRYNLEINQNNNYFANNILVHNCRCLATSYGLFTRKGKPYNVLPHIQESVNDILNKLGKNFVLDGELYKHGMDFQKIISGVKRDEANEITKEIQYHIYDLFCLDKDLTFENRLDILNSLKIKSPIFILPTYSVSNHEEAIKKTHDFIRDGYEGSILRNAHGLYQQDKRSYDLQKVKFFKDEEFEIDGWFEDKNNHAVFVCHTKDGVPFSVKPEGTDEERKNYLANAQKLCGKLLTVKFFGYTTGNNPVPRFPVGKGIRDYE